MLVTPYDLPTTDTTLAGAFEFGGGLMENPISPAPFRIGTGGDAISRLLPPAFGSSCGGCGAGGSGLSGILQQLGSLLQQLMGMLGGGQQWFQNANGSSMGDPHLSFNGSTWNDMNAQPDLLSSNSIPGGYQVSTQVTAPGANGVTYNQSANVMTNYGMTNVSFDASGNAVISQNGVQQPIAAGQTIDIGNGTTVARTPNALIVTANNGAGGTISTTMTLNGQGVDVENTAHNVDLGGTLVTHDKPEPRLY